MGISGGNVSISVHLTCECEKKEEGCRLFYQVLLCLMTWGLSARGDEDRKKPT